MGTIYNYIDCCNGYDIYEVETYTGAYYTACFEGCNPNTESVHDENSEQDIFEWCEKN